MKEPVKVADCTKAKFASDDAAFDFIESKVRRSKKNARPFNPLSIYFCSICLSWHITSQTKKYKINGIEKKILHLENIIKSKDERINFHSNRAHLLTQENSILKQKLLELGNCGQSTMKLNRDVYELGRLLNESNAKLGRQRLALGLSNGKINSYRKLLYSFALKRIHDKHEKRATLYPR